MEDNSGNEISLSIEETNKLRISLGLKPLRLDSGPSQANVERQNHEAKKQQEAAAQAQELRKKLEAAREKRLMDAKLKAVKTLGAADGDDGDGDMAAWVEKNRRLEQQRREEAAAKAAAAAEKAAAARNKRKKRDDSDDEGGGGGYKADELSGLKVRHDLGEVLEGETVIVTLADKPLLDDKGNLREGDSGDELENTLLAEEKRRRKAMKAAKKEAKPLWEEDGKVRTILDKYDEEEEEVVVAIGTGGMLEADRIRRQEEMRKKLAEGNAKLATFEGAAAGTAAGAGGDYYTAAEMAAFNKPRKKKDKKERRIRAKSAEPEQEPEGDILATLEAQAEEAGAGASDLGRRADRGAALAAKEEAAKVAAEQKRARFEAAVQKANWASQFLRNAKGGMAGAAAAAGGGGGAIGEEDEAADRELRESLERARRLAEKKKKDEEEEAARRAAEAAEAEAAGSGEDMDVEGEEKKERKPAAPKSGIAALFADIAVKKEPEVAAGGSGGTVLTETMEFVRNITAAPSKAAAKAPNGAASPAPRDGAASVGGSAGGARGAYADGDGSDLDDDDGDARMGDGEGGGGTWVAAQDGDGAEGGKGGREGSAGPAGARGASRERSLPPDEVGITGERAVGRGLAGALGLLQNKGELKDGVEWSGRNTDRSKNALQGLEDVFTGGRQTDRVARSVEAALTVKDKYGRVLTPKERFRQLCHSFHGIKPSKNQVDKAAARDAKELAIKKAATSEDPSAELDRLRAVQRATGSAYVVLSGKNAGLPAAAAGAGGGGGDSDDEDMGRGRAGGGGGGGRMKPPAPRPPGGGKGGPPAGGPAFPLSGARGTVGNLTPLLGDRKVEAMLGIKKPGGKK